MKEAQVTHTNERTFICPFCKISNVYDAVDGPLNRCHHNQRVAKYDDNNLIEQIVFRSHEIAVKAEELK